MIPLPPIPTGTEAAVCTDIATRQAKGVAKYGTTVRDNPLTLRQWLQHQYEELLDAAVYAKRAIEEIDSIEARAKESREKAQQFLKGQNDAACLEALRFTQGGYVSGPEPGSEPLFVTKPKPPKVSAWDELNAKAIATNNVPLSPSPRK